MTDQSESAVEPDEDRPRALYEAQGDVFTPSALTMGPWRPDAQHGGPPSGLLTFLCEQKVEPTETVARMAVNLLTGIPLIPLRGTVERRRISRRVAHVQAELRTEDRLVASATALILATGDMPQPAWAPDPVTVPPWSELDQSEVPRWAVHDGRLPFHREGLEHRFVSGRFAEPGAARDWVRLRQPVVGDTEPTGFQRVMSAVDVGSGISAVYDPNDGLGMINADLNVAFVAEPVGEWFLLDAQTMVGPAGTGMAVTRVVDSDRLVAVATQSLLGTSLPAG